ncbi:hypothetical protein NHF53_23555 [Ciceribacter sp. RN22]|nr:hypothetical protein [Ciceribacter sp. RN22]
MSETLTSSSRKRVRPAPSGGSRIIQAASVFVVVLVGLSPLFILVVAALKDDRFQILSDMGSSRAFWVDASTLNTFRDVGHFSGEFAFGRYLLNSLLILATTVVPGLIVNSMAGFVLASGRLPGRLAVLAIVIALYAMPQEGIFMPLLVMVSRMGLSDTFVAQIVPWVASPLYTFLFYQFFRNSHGRSMRPPSSTAPHPSESGGRSIYLSACPPSLLRRS